MCVCVCVLKNVLSTMKRLKKDNDVILKELPNKRKKIELDKEELQNAKEKKEKIAEKKIITTRDEQIIKQIEWNQFEPHLQKIKQMKNDSIRYFEVIQDFTSKNTQSNPVYQRKR